MLRLVLSWALLLGVTLAGALAVVVRPGDADLMTVQLAERLADDRLIQFAPAGDEFAVGGPLGSGGRVALWSLAARAERLAFTTEAAPTRLLYSPDGAALLVYDYRGVASIYRTSDGQPLTQLNNEASLIRDVGFLADGRAVTLDAAALRIWEMPGGALARVIPLAEASAPRALLVAAGEANDARSLLVAPDGVRIATAGGNSPPRVWHEPTGAALATLGGDGFSALIGFSPDSRLLLTAALSGYVRLWDTDTRQPVGSVNGYSVYSAATTPAGAVLIAGKGAALDDFHVVDVLSGELRFVAHASSALFSPDGRWLATTGSRWDRAQAAQAGRYNLPALDVRLWNVETGQPYVVFRGQQHVEHLWFSPDSRRLAFLDVGATLRLLTLPG